MAKNKDNKKNKAQQINPDTQDVLDRQNMPQGAYKDNPRGAK